MIAALAVLPAEAPMTLGATGVLLLEVIGWMGVLALATVGILAALTLIGFGCAVLFGDGRRGR